MGKKSLAALLCAKDLCKTYVIDKRQNNVLKNVNIPKPEYSYSTQLSAGCGSGGCVASCSGGCAGGLYDSCVFS